VSAGLYLGDPTGPVKVCGGCELGIVQIPSGIWVRATSDMTVDRVPCDKSADGLHAPALPAQKKSDG
jgi:hypothetical protein